MDHQEKHHQQHQKEREHEKKEQKAYDQAQDKKLLPIHPVWLLVVVFVLILTAVLIYTIYPW